MSANKVAPVLGVTQPDLAETVAARVPGLRLYVAEQNFAELFDAGGEARRSESDLTMAPLAIQFTSGTTSRPKGAVFTHANALWGARVGAAHMALGPDDVSLVYLPLFHIVGLSWITAGDAMGGRHRGVAAALFGEPVLAGVGRMRLHLHRDDAVRVEGAR